MKKFITTILALVYMLGGCTAADFKSNTSNDSSEEISIEASEAVSSEESKYSDTETSEESKAESNDSSESSDSSEESFEDISSDVSSEDPSEDVSSEESREEDVSSAPVPPVPPVGGGDNGNESKPEEDVSSSAPDVSEPEKDESKGDVPVTHTHSYSSIVYEPWCGEEGYTEYTCECGHTYKSDYTAALTHDYGEWKVIENPSTTKEGKQRRLCKICNKFEYETIPKIVVTLTQEDLDYMAECALEMLNEQRIAAGLQPLVTGPIAHQMASERAVQLVTDFSHNGCNEIFHKYMYNPDDPYGNTMLGGENIAKSIMSTETGLTINKQNHLRVTGRGLMGGFQLSAGHWGDLMSADYTACGVGVYAVRVSEDKFDTYICVLTMDKLYGTDANQ